MKFIRFVALLVLGLVFVLGLNAQINVQAQGGGTFVAATHEDLKGAQNYISSISGANNTVWNAYVWAGKHPSLYGVTILGQTPFPSMATGFVPVTTFKKQGDFFVNEVKILQGAKWSDGVEITAEDWAFTFNELNRKIASGPDAGKSLALALGFGSTIEDFIERVEAVDRYTVRFVLKKEPGLGTWEFGFLQSAVYPKHYWESRFQQAFASENPVQVLLGLEGADEPSAGALQFKQWRPGSFAETVANPNYSFKGTVAREYEGGGYQETLPANLGGTTRSVGNTSGQPILETTDGPFVDGVIYSLFGSQALGAQAVIQGDADFAFNPLGYGVATLRQLQQAANVKVFKNADRGVFYMSFNLRKSPFNYVNFRKAVRCVVDKEFVANELLSGLVLPTYTPVSPVFGAGHRELTEQDRAEACIGLSEDARLARARQLLQEEGFQFDAQGKLTKDPQGNSVPELQLLHPNAAYDNNRNIFGIHIVDRLNKLGVPVKDVPAGFNNIVTLVFDDQDFDMWQLGWRFDSPIPLFLWDLFNSVNATPPNAAAQGGVCSAREDAINGCQQKFDELSNQLLAEQNLDKVNEIAVQLQKMIFDNVAYVETHNLQLTEPFRTDRVAWQGLEKLDGKVANGLQGGNGYLGLAQKK